MRADRSQKLGRRPGHQDTRGVILTAARAAFAARGFAGASVRGIAADAGVDPALVHHYFANKDELFLATVQVPVDLPQIIDRVTADGLDGLGERVVSTLLSIWDSELQAGLVGALRTALNDPAMARSLSEFVTSEVLGRLMRPTRLSPAVTADRLGLVGSQLLGLIIGRYVLRLPALTDRPAAELVADLGPTVQRYLDGT